MSIQFRAVRPPSSQASNFSKAAPLKNGGKTDPGCVVGEGAVASYALPGKDKNRSAVRGPATRKIESACRLGPSR